MNEIVNFIDQVWSGIPARKVRDLSKEEKAEIQALCDQLTKVSE